MTKNDKNVVISQILASANPSISEIPLLEKLNLPRSTLEYYIKKLEDDNLIKRIPHTKPVFWDITDEGKSTLKRLQCQLSSLGMSPEQKPLIKIHNFSVELPLVRDQSEGFWERSWELNNWVKQFKDLQDMGVSVERTPKTVTINFRPQEVREEKITPLIFNGTFSIIGFLAKQGIEVNPWGIKVSRQEYASEQPLVRRLTDKGMTFRQSLGRPQARIFGSDTPKEAAAWLDASQGRPEIDTNDVAYARNLLQMPEFVSQIREMTVMGFEFQKVYTENLKLHMAVMNRILKVTTKLDRYLSQRNIREFL